MKAGLRSPFLARWLLHRMAAFQDNYLAAGDMEEVFHEMAQSKGRSWAGFWYWRQVLGMVPVYGVQSILWRLGMFKNYLKSAIRNLRKNRLFTVISLVGLALAIGSFSVTFVFIDTMDNIDNYHKKVDRLYYANIMIERSGDSQLWGPTPEPLGPAMLADIPQVANSSRIRNRTGIVKVGGKALEEHVVFADNGYVDMFTFNLLEGSWSQFGEANTVLLHEDVALKYFGRRDVSGQTIELSNRAGFKDEFTVAGVVEKMPQGATIQFGVLMPYARIEDWDETDTQSWTSWTNTFIELKEGAKIDDIKTKLQPYIEIQNGVSDDWKIQRFVFEPLGRLVAESGGIRNSINNGPPAESKIAMFFFGFSLVLMACLNYINIGIVVSTRRLREIGIRKVMGSSRGRLIVQFISENVLLCILALIIGAALAGQFLIPSFNKLFGAPLKLDLMHNMRLWIFFAATLFVTAFVSGGYPAIFVSRFRPADILRRNEKVGGGTRLTRIFLGFQIFLAFVMLSSGIVFVENSRYQKRLDWGYDQDRVLTVPVRDNALYEPYRNEISQHADIEFVSGSAHHVGTRHEVQVVTREDKTWEIDGFSVDPQYFATMGLRLKSGRLFDEARSGDASQSIVITQLCAETMDLKEPLGSRVAISGQEYYVIGVVENFYNRVFAEMMKPALFKVAGKEDMKFVSVRVRPGSQDAVFEYLKERWEKLTHEYEFEGFYQSRIWDWYFRDAKGVNQISLFVGFSALLIACMGLFGMVSISILKRIKEVTIRKVLGASGAQIVTLLNRDLMWLMGISLSLAMPAGYLLMRSYMAMAYRGQHLPLTPWPFVISALVLLITVLATLSSQMIKAARGNVVKHLKVD